MVTASRTSERRARQQLHAAALAARGEHYRAKQLLDCALEDEIKGATGYRTWRCQQRTCLICGWRYSKRLIRLYGSMSENLLAKGFRLSFLTLTIPNVVWLKPNLYRWLSASFKKLRHRELFRDRVNGAISIIETDFYPDSQEYHVHIHGLLSYQQCIPQEELAEAWSKLTALPPDGFPVTDAPERVVDIRKVDPESIKEVLDYMFKFNPIEDPEAFAEYDCAVRNVRLVNAYGIMRTGR